MKSANLDRLSSLPTPPLREYYSRVLAYIATAASIAAGTYTQYFGFDVLWIVPYALLYPHLAHHLSLRFKRDHPERTHLVLLFIDALHAGAGAALLGFSVVPSLMFLLTLSFSALIIGGLRQLGLAILVAASATVLTTVIAHPDLKLGTPALVSFVSICFTTLYVCITAFFVHQQGLRLALARSEIKLEQEKAARLARNLAKYLSPQVWEMIFSGKRHVRLETQRKKLTVFFSDIKGFTELSEELEAEALTDLLNNYLNEMSKIALKYGGTIDKFVGDCVMVFFGDPSTQGAKKDAVAAVSMAIAMRKHMKVLRQQWRAQGITKPLEIRMGLNTGYCTVGNFGADTRMDYTIIGRDVNLASRLESASEAGEILISHETYSLIKDVIMCRDKGQITVKGFARPVQIYQVVDFRRDLGATSSYVEHELPGFSMYLDTNGIQNYDKEKVIQALHLAAEKLRDKVIL
ncbi:protein CyaB [Pseudomonas solani]|uniref:Adenylate/guanylate cyclase domain-containing protein n=1 Tax=Pseudomonas solani TaxID=2731552 RepID=A0AAU7Y6R7_9PSED|nr:MULTISPECIES: adenylate/guanylate cyclase domain-containing protein [Pseudomonas]EQM67536.1 adenylate cyclase [Pseudomonas alcaligenes OT 69]MBB4821322.1 class 3 adenylate cyclase [Pseudomonas alcaligenes]MDN4147739.1 adenylate/guanylate cyclase domain-containing protein [Pseudomonas tohonis]MDU9412901.1 adenylate/guanylate cyclase domain-containing protein [Pseudomonas sp. zfem005]WCD82109.1 adenylate/guanylate cyclase domain-containing protein [Pseudomonas sp. TUM22785]